MKQRWGVIGFVAAISLLSGGWLLQRGIQSGGNVYQQARLFDEVLSHINKFYVDSIPESELYQKATTGMLEQLRDPYSVLLMGEDFRALTEQTSGNFAGIGIQIDVRNGWITVVAPLPETPAERAGIETGDQIVEVDGRSTEGWSSEQAVKTLRGEPDSPVTLTVRRAGLPEPLTFDIIRARIHVRSVPSGILFDDGIGYLSLNPVSETSAEELRREIVALREQGMQALILNLRLNPGGLLDQGVKVADLFLDANQEIVSTRGRTQAASRKFFDVAAQTWPDLPLVVLVNDGTASAAEIIAGALQDHDRAVVIGTPTFGKGLVQSVYPLGDDVALKLTTARWYTPSGRTIQREAEAEPAELAAAAGDTPGVPDVPKELTDSAIQERPAFYTDAGRIVRGGGGIVPDLIVPQDTLTADEQQFAQALGSRLPAYRDALTSYALAMKRNNVVTSESFAVTPSMRAEVYNRLRANGVDIAADIFHSAGHLVDRQLGYEIARYSFGTAAESRRRAADDRQVQRALELLRQAESPNDLMALATTAKKKAP